MLSTLELLRKYDVPGPRYTSYPTVPAWKESITAEDYAASLFAVKPDENLSLYFHLPFCEKLCHFCGCFKIITKDHSRSLPYVRALISEVGTVRQHLGGSDRKVTQIHFGGGTPNFIEPCELSFIMDAVRANFSVLPGAEIAIEMHPRTSTLAFCENLKKEGFNRISLGVQDFDDEVQRLINRFQTFDMTRDMVTSLRNLGFDSFNFDLIYGLPGQTLAKFKRTLELTLALRPDRLAVYSYAHVPWVSPVQRSFADADLPGPEAKLELFEMAYGFLSANGYRQIGMDHFALQSDELFKASGTGGLHRNFMGYSTRVDAHQIGLGISGISYVNGNYFQNAKKMEVYTSSVHDIKLPIIRGCNLHRDDHIRRDLITDIMCRMVVNVPSFEIKHGIDFKTYFAADLPALDELIGDGLVTFGNDGLKVTDQGKLILRNIAMCFDRYLNQVRSTARTPVFSRTV